MSIKCLANKKKIFKNYVLVTKNPVGLLCELTRQHDAKLCYSTALGGYETSNGKMKCTNCSPWL